MDDRVIVDTCIWASFFSKPSSPEKNTVDELIDSDRVMLIGPILAEVLMDSAVRTRHVGSLRGFG
jgi:hypothetical protein